MASPEAMIEEISKLSVEQLRQVKEQVDNEVSVLQDSLGSIRTAATRFEMASKALSMLSTQPAALMRDEPYMAGSFVIVVAYMKNMNPHDTARVYGKKMLVPLTASLYASGTLANTDTVLVDVGTGYYIEKPLPDGKDYCERKIKFLKENHQKLVEVATGKQNAAEQVAMVLQAKMRQGSSVSPSQRA